MKKILKKFTLMAVATAGMLSISSCEKEVNNAKSKEVNNAKSAEFKGEIIGSEICTNEIVGFLIDVYNPNDIGDSLLENGIQYTNVVKTYSISQDSATVGDVISGTFEILPDSLQSRVCPYMHQIYDVPEIIINH